MIKGIHHVSIKCIKEDYEKAKSFYTDVLGLTLGEEIEFFAERKTKS